MSAKSIMITIVLSGMLFAGCGTVSQAQKEREKRMQNSPQYKDGKFVNPIDAPLMAPGSTWKYIMKQFFTSRIDPEPTGELPLNPIQPRKLPVHNVDVLG